MVTGARSSTRSTTCSACASSWTPSATATAPSASCTTCGRRCPTASRTTSRRRRPTCTSRCTRRSSALPASRSKIQIRTREMHRAAKYGIAAHWRYKEGSKQAKEASTEAAWLGQLIDWLKDWPIRGVCGLAGASIYAAGLRLHAQGRRLNLPAGATPLDFAYRDPHRCRAPNDRREDRREARAPGLRVAHW